ncbi:MAG: hypothetical protein Q4A01_08430 [Coriobacteriales bacterium]|nr:hypothetical protein [Coriobacteriales bacterium]
MSLKRTTPNVSRRGALRLAATVAGLGLACPPVAALADTNSDLANAQAQLKEAEARLAGIASEYEELSAAQSQTLDDLYDVENKIEEIGKRIVVLENDLAAKQQELSKSVREEYKDGNHGVVDLILAATTIEELISNIYYFDKVSAEKARLIQSVKDAHDALQREQEELESERKNLEEISQEQEAQLEAMRDKQLEAQQVIDGLSKDVRDLLAKRDAELLAAQKEAEAARKQREEAAAAQKKKEKEQAAASSSTKTQQQESTNGNENKTTESKPAEDADKTKQESAPAPEPEPEPEPAATPGGSAGRGGNGTGSAAAVVAACHSTPSPGLGLCAGWCSDVMINAGYGFVAGNANDMYAAYCFSSNRADLQPGMAVAVSSHPHTTMGQIYGHIGMYIGGGMMMDNVGYIRTISVDEWCSFYGATVAPRWGWLNGIVLT